MKHIIPLLIAMVIPALLTGCAVLESAAHTVGSIIGVDESAAPVESDAIIRNEYHAACVREKREAIKDILGEGEP